MEASTWKYSLSRGRRRIVRAGWANIMWPLLVCGTIVGFQFGLEFGVGGWLLGGAWDAALLWYYIHIAAEVVITEKRIEVYYPLHGIAVEAPNVRSVALIPLSWWGAVALRLDRKSGRGHIAILLLAGGKRPTSRLLAESTAAWLTQNGFDVRVQGRPSRGL